MRRHDLPDRQSLTGRAKGVAVRAARFLLVPAGTEALWRETKRVVGRFPAARVAAVAAHRLTSRCARPFRRSFRLKALVALLLLGSAILLFAPTAFALPDWLVGGLGALETLVGHVEAIFTSYLGVIKDVAFVILSLLVGIELAVSGAKWGLQRRSISDMLYRLSFKALIIGMAFAIIADTNATCVVIDDSVDCPMFNMEYIRDGFVALAVHTTPATQPYYPRDVFVGFGNIVSEMWQRATGYNWWMNAWLILIMGIAVIVLFAEYIVIAVKLFVLILESAIAISVGLIFVAFLGFRGTAGLGERYITWIVGISVELFLINLILYAAEQAIPTAYQYLLNPLDGWQIFDALLVPLFAAVFCGAVLYIPRAASRYLTSSMSLGIRNVMRL